MRLRFLGTGASEGYPVLFCACDDCETARARGGPSIRRRSALMVDDDLLIDFGPDIGEATRAMRLPLHRVEHLLITHAHGDHLSVANFDYHRARWAKRPLPVLHVYGSAASLEPIRRMPWTLEEAGLELHPVEPGETFQAGPYRVTALQSVFYVVQRDGCAFLYATDTGAFHDETWALLESLTAGGVLLDAAIVEGTMGFQDLPPTAGHLTVPRCGEHHQEIRARGLTRSGCRHLATHFSPAAGTHPHEETAAFLAPYGVEPAYDGLEIDIPADPSGDAGGGVRVETADYRDVRSWLDLAAEVEWCFGNMLGGAGFYRALLNNIERGTAFCVREDGGPPGAPLVGGVLFSPARPDRLENHIRWLSVAERSRRRGVGTALVGRVFGLVEPPATLSVVTFGEDSEAGRAARRFYERMGFEAAEATPDGSEGGSRQLFRRQFPSHG